MEERVRKKPEVVMNLERDVRMEDTEAESMGPTEQENIHVIEEKVLREVGK